MLYEYNFFMWILITLVAIESSYFSVCQHVRVQISNSSASVFVLTAFVRHLPHVRPHLYLKTWCVRATYVCSCHTSYLSQEPRVYPCKFFLAGVNFYRFNAKNWHFRQILREKVAFLTDLTQKIGIFRCNFFLQKFCLCKKMTNIRYANER